MRAFNQSCYIDKGNSRGSNFSDIFDFSQLKKRLVRNLNHADIFIDSGKGMRSHPGFRLRHQSIKKRRFTSVGKSYNTYFKTHITVKIIKIVIDLTSKLC